MAVMSTQLSDPDALEQKALPGSTNEKVAEDHGINGGTVYSSVTKSGFEFESESAPKDIPALIVEPSHQFPEASTIVANALSASSNFSNGYAVGADAQTIIPALDEGVPKDILGDFTSNPTGTTATSIPPVVEAPTSELRDDTGPVAGEEILGTQDSKLLPALKEDIVAEIDQGLEGSGAIGTTAIGESTPAPLEDKMDVEEKNGAAVTAITDLPHHPPVPVSDVISNGEPRNDAPPLPEPTIARLGADPPIVDHDMQDVPQSPTKNVRVREDDDQEDGPATKRTKTEDEGSAAPEFRVPQLPQTAIPAQPADKAPTPMVQSGESIPITKTQHKFLMSVLKGVKRNKDAKFFLAPVDVKALNIPSYPSIIKHPMDLGTMEVKLKEERYQSVEEIVFDFDLILQNAIKFNGLEHVVTKAGSNLKILFDRQLTNLPKVDVKDPAPAEKKAKKPPAPPVLKATPPRRESRASVGTAKSPPVSAGSPQTAQTFALGPQGVPLIRRDSTVGDGRPKREIHAPPPRDLPYSTAKPRKKKYQWELRFCQEVLNEMYKPKYGAFGYAFHNPVDPVALNIPHYHKIIKKPMDLSTISAKLKNGQYENAKEFEGDVRLIFQNCYKFNPAGDAVNAMGKQFEAVFDDKWAEKKQWIESHAPSSGPQSPGSSPEPDDEDEDEEVEEEEEEEENQLTILQKQIAAMSKQVEMIQKKKTSPPAASKKGLKSAKPTKKATKKGPSATPAPVAVKRTKQSQGKHKKDPGQRIPYVTYEQKQDISNRINNLPEARMQTALRIIRDNMPNLQGVQEDEIELDIDELSNEVLYQLLVFVREYAPAGDGEPASAPRPKAPAAPKSGAAKPKKNKPMSKYEQEARIHELQGKLKGFQGGASDDSPEPAKQEGDEEESSGDESDSGSESEEE
ncbi:MAG: hypothetical protein M1827_005072 [Pycnora praestabilis]|nr:MAG: hypothetical protein M1827_005072 [Pycnora praestabilis]